MIDTSTKYLTAGMFFMLLAAWRTLPLLIVVLVLDRVLLRRIAARYQCWLWTIVIARLLLPCSISSPVSLAGPIDRNLAGLFAATTSSNPKAEELLGTFTFENGQEVTTPLFSTHTAPPQSWRAVPNQDTQEAIVNPAAISKSAIKWDVVVVNCAVWLWAIGACTLILRACIAYSCFVLQLRKSPKLSDPSLVEQVLRICDEQGVPLRPKVRLVDALAVPAVFGLWKPVLCLPSHSSSLLSTDELSFILRHELAHIKRRDVLLLSVASLVKSLHWFNPIAWLAESKLKAYVEQAADEVATREMTPSKIANYGHLLLRFASAEGSTSRLSLVGLVSMAAKGDLTRRIERLRQHCVSRSRVRRWLVPLMCVVVAISGLTDASAPKPNPDGHHLQPSFQAFLDHAVIEPTNKSVELMRPVSIDVRAALAKAEELRPGIDAKRFLTNYFPGTIPNDIDIEDGTLKAELTPNNERCLRQMLRAFERGGAWQISIESRIVQADLRFARSFNWNAIKSSTVIHDSLTFTRRLDEEDSECWRELFPEPKDLSVKQPVERGVRSRPMLTARLSDWECKEFLRSCQNDARSNVLQAPKITMLNGQAATIRDGIERPFVTNVEMMSGATGSSLQPTIEIVHEGCSIRLRVEVSEEQLVDLGCIVSESKIVDVELANLPIRLREEPNADVVVQVPNVQSKTIGARMQLADHESLLIMSPRSYRNNETAEAKLQANFYLFTPRLIAETESLKAFVR